MATSTFRAYLAARPAAALELLTVTVNRLRHADRQRAEFGSDATARLARSLSALAREHGRVEGGGIRLGLLSQDDLAALCGASREAVSRALRTLREAGLLTTGRCSITILDIDAIDAWEP